MHVSIEQDVNWITDCSRICATAASRAWKPPSKRGQLGAARHRVANKTLYPKAASWYMGANIEGKPRVFMPYIGGVNAYREKCTEIAANGYTGFRLTGASKVAQAAE